MNMDQRSILAELLALKAPTGWPTDLHRIWLDTHGALFIQTSPGVGTRTPEKRLAWFVSTL